MFFFQAEDGIRDVAVTGVQTCALPIYVSDELGRRIAGRDLELGRIAQQSLGEGADLIGEGGREEQVLPLRRQQRSEERRVGKEWRFRLCLDHYVTNMKLMFYYMSTLTH